MKIEVAGSAGKPNYFIDVWNVKDFQSIGSFQSTSTLFDQPCVVSYDIFERGSGFAVAVYLSTGKVTSKHSVRYGMKKDKALIYMIKNARKRGIDIAQVVGELRLNNETY